MATRKAASKPRKRRAKPSSSQLEIRYVPLDEAVPWDRNPKRHDVDALVQSILRYGFRDAPIFDAKLGAIAAGNGRIKALAQMQAEEMSTPRGIRVGPEGEWLVPVQFGVDAKSRAEAEAFGVDHNNLTLADLGPDAMLGLWDEQEFAELLESLQEAGGAPETMPPDELKELLEAGGAWEEGIAEGLGRTKNEYAVRPLLTLDEVETFERAMTKTGLVSRAEAWIEICRAYLGDEAQE